ncbi:MAG: beta-lactamase family protein [Clostridiales bacterium]|nr:beta-lactamase family protein [Clostridiales bacterium]
MRILDRDKLVKKLTDRANEDIKWKRIAGAAMIVRQSGEIVANLKLGVRDITTGELLRKGDIFRLASNTKPTTGAACLVALDRGYFDLYDKVSDYLPQFRDMYVGRIEGDRVVPDRKAKSDILIYQLLSHCSGLVAEDEIGNLQKSYMPRSVYETNRTMTDYCAEHTYLSFDPSAKTAYSGYAAFDVVMRIIEDKSGMTHAEFLKRNIFDKIGIKDLTFNPTEEQWSRMVTMHDRTDDPSMVTVEMGRHTFEGFPLTYTSGGASLCGSIEDYSVFAELLRREGEYDGERVFDEKLIDLMKTPYVPDGTPGRNETDSWGLGVRVVVHDSILPIGSYGWSGAYGTHFWVDPENDITAVYMKNNRWYDSHGAGLTGLNFERDVMSCLI